MSDIPDGTASAAEIAAHPAISAAAVSSDGSIAYLVPDRDKAPLLWRSCTLEATGRLDGLTWHEPADDLRIAQLNRTETDFLHTEVDIYLRKGLALPAGAVVVDVGANIGMFSLRAAKTSPGARIVAVEPVAEAARAIEVNAELHQADITVLHCGLGRESGERDFVVYPNNVVMSSFYADVAEDRGILHDYMVTGKGAERIRQLDAMVEDRMAAQKRRCPVNTLTEVVEQHGIGEIDLLKIDVEKAEADVLTGIDDSVWPRIRQIVLEVHDIDGRLRKVLGHLEELGFRTAWARDVRLSEATHFTVYGSRGTVPAPSARRAPAERWPTLRALRRDLAERLSRERSDARLPERLTLLPDLAGVAEERSKKRPVPPGHAVIVLQDVWREFFGAWAVRDDADFFELGADSLTAVRFLAVIEERLGAGILAPDAIFTGSRFGDLVKALGTGVSS